MWDLLWYLIAGAAAGAAVVAVVNYWDQIRETLRSWLHQHGLQHSWLMSAFVFIEKVMGRVRSRLFAKGSDQKEYLVEERDLSQDEINSDPELAAALAQNKAVTQSVAF